MNKRTFRWVVCAVGVLAAAPAAPAQEADPAKDEQIKKLVAEYDRLEAKARELGARYGERQRKASAAVTQMPEIARLEANRQELRAAFYNKYETDPSVAAADQAASDARKALEAAKAEAGARLPQVQAAQAENDAAEKARSDLQAKMRESTDAIAAVRKGLQSHPEVVAILAARVKAQQSMSELRHTDPQIVGAQRAVDQARRAYQAALQQWMASSPEYKAMQAAQKAYGETLKTHNGMALAQKALEAADKQAAQAVEELLAADATAAAHAQSLKQLAEQYDALRLGRAAAQRKLSEAWRAALTTDPALQQFAQRHDEAARLASQTREALYAGPERQAYDKASAELQRRFAEAMQAADPELADLSKELQAVSAERMKAQSALRRLGVRQSPTRRRPR